MNKKYTFLFLLLTFLTLPFLGKSQEAASIMVIGEKGEAYDDHSSTCPEMLLTAAGSMEGAFGKWLDMMKAVQEFAKSVDVDLNGVKLWINVYWNQDGSIRALAYHPKPTSKNIEMGRLTTLFKEFAKTYKLDLSYERCYSHYGSAAFPVQLMGGR